jgi:hypothetical protein
MAEGEGEGEEEEVCLEGVDVKEGRQGWRWSRAGGRGRLGRGRDRKWGRRGRWAR